MSGHEDRAATEASAAKDSAAKASAAETLATKAKDRRVVLIAAAMLIGAMALWGSNSVVARLMVTNMPPLSAAFWRWTAVIAAMAPFVLPKLGRALPHLRASGLFLIGLAIIGPFSFILLNYWGLQRTTAVNASITHGASPVLTVLASWLIVHERISRRTALGMAIAFSGTLAFVAHGDPARLLALDVNLGDLAIVAASACWALYSVLLRYVPKGLDPTVLVFVITAVALVLQTPLYAWELSQGLRINVTWGNVALLVYSGAIISVFANLFWIKGNAVLGANIAAQFNYLTPILGSALAVALLGEAFELYHFVGMSLVLAGVYIATVLGRRS